MASELKIMRNGNKQLIQQKQQLNNRIRLLLREESKTRFKIKKDREALKKVQSQKDRLATHRSQMESFREQLSFNATFKSNETQAKRFFDQHIRSDSLKRVKRKLAFARKQEKQRNIKKFIKDRTLDEMDKQFKVIKMRRLKKMASEKMVKVKRMNNVISGSQRFKRIGDVQQQISQEQSNIFRLEMEELARIQRLQNMQEAHKDALERLSSYRTWDAADTGISVSTERGIKKI